MGAMDRKGDPVEIANQQRREDEGHVEDHVPQQFIVIDLLQVHERPQQVDGRNCHNGGGHLDLQGASSQRMENNIWSNFCSIIVGELIIVCWTDQILTATGEREQIYFGKPSDIYS